jgi:hypothetical protein
MRLRTSLLSAVLCLGLLTGACSQSKPDAADLRKDLSSELQKGTQRLTKRQADCYAKLIVAEVGVDDLNDVKLDDEEPTSKMGKQLAAVAAEATSKCDLDDQP